MSRSVVARAVVVLGLALLVAAATVQLGLIGALWSLGGSVFVVGLLLDVDEAPRKGR